MNERFKECVAAVLEHEGGFVNHPADPGGATNFGITLRTLRAWRRNSRLEPADVAAMPRAEAVEIYFANYWNAMRCADLPAGVDAVMFDFGVNAGTSRAARHLQRILGVTMDGAVGPQTIAAARARPAAGLVRDLCAARLDYLRSLPTWSTFGRGWKRRCDAVEAAAVASCVA